MRWSDPFIRNNPILIQILGVCSLLAVTNKLSSSLLMGLALTFVLALSNFTISLLRRLMLREIRLIMQMTVIATLVMIADQIIKAFFYPISLHLSIYVSLIITNCIVLGRAEAFALSHHCWASLLDGLLYGLAYTALLLIVALLRELLGQGKFLGWQFDLQNNIFNMSASVFIIIGLLMIFIKQENR